MPNYKEIPRQGRLSSNPIYNTNPRRFARTRCEKAMNACDRAILYLGELIQIYAPEDLTPTEAASQGLDFANFAIEKGIDFNTLIDLGDTTPEEKLPLGKFTGYIAYAALMMKMQKDIRDSIAELRSTI